MEDSRRTLFTRAIFGLWGLIAAGLVAPAMGYLLGPRKTSGKEEWIEVGSLDSLPAEGAEEVVFRRNRVDGWKVVSEKSTAWVVKKSESEVIAFAPQCTHLGCAYSYDDKKKEFTCPCHTSAFSMEGKVLMGPAPRSLDRYTVRVEGGKVLLGGLDQPLREL